MFVSRGNTDTDMRRELNMPRFVWRVAELYQEARKLRLVDSRWWQKLDKSLAAYDLKHPTGHRFRTNIPPPVVPGAPAAEPNIRLPVVVTTATTTQPPPSSRKLPAPQRIHSPPSASPSSFHLPKKTLPLPTPKGPKPGSKPGPSSQHPAPTSQYTSGPRTEMPPPSRALPSKSRKRDYISDSGSFVESVESSHGKKGKGKARARTEDASSEDEWEEKRPSTSQMKRKFVHIADEDEDEDHDDLIRGRKPPKTTGKQRKVICTRCFRLNMPCLVQDKGRACMACACLKQKCVDVEVVDADEVASMAPPTAPTKAPIKVPTKAPSKAPSKAPPKATPKAPSKATSKATSMAPTQETIKVRPAREAVRPEPTRKREAKQPPPSKRRKSNKPAKSVEILPDDTSCEEDVSDFQAKKTRTFGELAKGTGMPRYVIFNR
jgi:hypothetical protein